MENDEIIEELEALRRGFNYVRQRQESAEQVLEEITRELLGHSSLAIELAKRFDRMASKTEAFDADHAGVRWLRSLRDDLISRHEIIPVIQQAFENGQIQPLPPGAHLQLVGDARTASQTSLGQTPAHDPAPDPAPHQDGQSPL